MNSFILFNCLNHCFRISLSRKNIHAQSKCGNSVDRNALMNGKNVSMKPCNCLQDNRQKPRFIIHLDNKGDRLSPCLFMKWKNIIFVFVERASADSCALCCILYSVHFAGVQKLLCLHHLQQDFRNCSFPHYKIFLFLCYWFLHINLPVRSLKTFVFTHWIYYHTTQKYARNIFC